MINPEVPIIPRNVDRLKIKIERYRNLINKFIK